MFKLNSRTILMTLFLTLFIVRPVIAESARLDENEVKAAYIYNFAKYVDWPETPSRLNPTLNFCIIGISPINSVMTSMTGKLIKNRKVSVRELRHTEGLNDCNLLFVNSTMKAYLPQILSSAVLRPLLTISDYSGFAATGGIIEFVPVGGKIKFKINNRSAKSANLKISSHLLNLAVTILE